MSEQRYDFFGEIFQRYFRPAIGAYPQMGGALVERLLTFTDDVPDRLAQTRRAAMAWGKAGDVTERSIGAAEHAGANTVLVNMNRGAMPHAMFLAQIRRFGAEVLPALQAHEVKTSPFA